jgi:ribosome-associated translation inhibitor RaiA
MSIHISGDTLALDKAIRQQIEHEARLFQERFPDATIDARVRINEEFDQLHGHRVRCELRADFGAGRQLVVREARKNPVEAINEAFGTARRNLRKLRRRSAIPTPTPGLAVTGAAAR